MKFSIITICFNSEFVIKKTIESVLAQDFNGDVEYIIIDGKSTDNTLKIIESYRNQFEKKGYAYLVFSERDNGIYDAMNKGLKKASGSIIGIINSGDWYEPITLSTVAKSYSSCPFDMFYADINLIRSDGSIIVKHSREDRIISSRHWNHPSSFVTKETYDELGLFKCKGIHDDFEFFLRAKKAKKNIVIKSIVLADFMVGGTSNAKSLKKSLNRIKDRYWCYRVNGFSPLYIFECIATEAAKAILS